MLCAAVEGTGQTIREVLGASALLHRLEVHPGWLVAIATGGIAMPLADRHCLLFGTYRTPVFKYGDVVICDVHGQVEIVGLSVGRIPWPIGKRGRAKALVLCGALAKAVLLEAAVAMAYWGRLGPDSDCVATRARRRHDDPGNVHTQGPHPLGEQGERMRQLARAKDCNLARRDKIAASRRVKPRPAYVVKAMRHGNVGRVHSDEERRKRSEGHKRRGTRPPKAGRAWSAAEDKLVRRLPPAEAARRTGRKLGAVYARHELRVPGGGP
jgi:hypothetical protein